MEPERPVSMDSGQRALLAMWRDTGAFCLSAAG